MTRNWFIRNHELPPITVLFEIHFTLDKSAYLWDDVGPFCGIGLVMGIGACIVVGPNKTVILTN